MSKESFEFNIHNIYLKVEINGKRLRQCPPKMDRVDAEIYKQRFIINIINILIN